jgi:hypothetical protein
VTVDVESCQGKVVGERVETGGGGKTVRETLERNFGEDFPVQPSIEEEFFQMKVRLFSLMAAIPLVFLSGGSVSAFAQSPAEVSKIAAAFPIGSTSAQKSQATRVARQTEHINTTSGYVSVSSTALT